MDLSSQGIGGGVEGVALRKRDLAKTTMTETWPMDMSAIVVLGLWLTCL